MTTKEKEIVSWLKKRQQDYLEDLHHVIDDLKYAKGETGRMRRIHRAIAINLLYDELNIIINGIEYGRTESDYRPITFMDNTLFM